MEELKEALKKKQKVENHLVK